MNMLLQEAPELIVRYGALEMLARERVAIAVDGRKPSWELAWEKRKVQEVRLGRSRREEIERSLVPFTDIYIMKHT